VFTDGTCDCVKEVLIRWHERNIAVGLLTVRVTLLKYYLYVSKKRLYLCVY